MRLCTSTSAGKAIDASVLLLRSYGGKSTGQSGHVLKYRGVFLVFGSFPDFSLIATSHGFPKEEAYANCLAYIRLNQYFIT